MLAGLAAVLASAALAWWIGGKELRTPPAPTPTPARPEPLARVHYAPVEPDAGQIRRAYRETMEAYAQGGAAGLLQASQDCAEALPLDPQRLDYCLALDIYVAAIILPRQDGAWFQDVGGRGFAQAQGALPPGVGPGARLAKVAALTRALASEIPSPTPIPAVQRSKHLPQAHPAKPRPKAAQTTRAKPTVAKRSAKYPPGASRRPQKTADPHAADNTRNLWLWDERRRLQTWESEHLDPPH